MLFDWDDEKSDKNLRCRGFDFEYAAHVFDGETEEFIDARDDTAKSGSSLLAILTAKCMP